MFLSNAAGCHSPGADKLAGYPLYWNQIAQGYLYGVIGKMQLMLADGIINTLSNIYILLLGPTANPYKDIL